MPYLNPRDNKLRPIDKRDIEERVERMTKQEIADESPFDYSEKELRKIKKDDLAKKYSKILITEWERILKKQKNPYEPRVMKSILSDKATENK